MWPLFLYAFGDKFLLEYILLNEDAPRLRSALTDVDVAFADVAEALEQKANAADLLALEARTAATLDLKADAHTVTTELAQKANAASGMPARACACDLVGPGFRAYLQSDGYSGYKALGVRGGITHVRRKFVDVLKASPKKGGLAGTGVDLMVKLYHHESVARKEGFDAAKLLALREEKIHPILNNIINRLREAAPTVPPQSLLGKAITYARGQWPRNEAYLGDACLTPDNNAAENAIRPFAVGHKNWLFAGSPRGAAASATLYSLIETAKANDLNPHAYLVHLFER